MDSFTVVNILAAYDRYKTIDTPKIDNRSSEYLLFCILLKYSVFPVIRQIFIHISHQLLQHYLPRASRRIRLSPLLN